MRPDGQKADNYGIAQLTKELSIYPSLVVADANEGFFERLRDELQLQLHRFSSGEVHNGWTIPHKWTVQKATVSLNGRVLFDGCDHTPGVAMYSRSFRGTLTYNELRQHVVVHDKLPDAYIFHCMW